MRRWIAVVVLAVSLIGQVSQGHEPAESLVVKKNWVRFDLVLGRITATQTRGGRRNCTHQSDSEATRRELLSVSSNPNAPSIRYELSDADQWLTVEIVKRNDVRIVREPQPDSETRRFQFVQPHQGAIKVSVETVAGTTKTFTADSIWHLLLAEPEMCQQELVPIFNLLRPHWKLTETANRIEVGLLRAATDGEGVSMADVRHLVDALEDPKFAIRRQADQRLRAIGVVVLTHLRQLDRATLSREQRHRIERIEKDMNVLKPDTSERIVAWLLNDESVWLSMLGRQDANKRQVAAARLRESHPAATKFDPLAAEALREKQIDALRLRISARR